MCDSRRLYDHRHFYCHQCPTNDHERDRRVFRSPLFSSSLWPNWSSCKENVWEWWAPRLIWLRYWESVKEKISYNTNGEWSFRRSIIFEITGVHSEEKREKARRIAWAILRVHKCTREVTETSCRKVMTEYPGSSTVYDCTDSNLNKPNTGEYPALLSLPGYAATENFSTGIEEKLAMFERLRASLMRKELIWTFKELKVSDKPSLLNPDTSDVFELVKKLVLSGR